MMEVAETVVKMALKSSIKYLLIALHEYFSTQIGYAYCELTSYDTTISSFILPTIFLLFEQWLKGTSPLKYNIIPTPLIAHDSSSTRIKLDSLNYFSIKFDKCKTIMSLQYKFEYDWKLSYCAIDKLTSLSERIRVPILLQYRRKSNFKSFDIDTCHLYGTSWTEMFLCKTPIQYIYASVETVFRDMLDVSSISPQYPTKCPY